MKREVRTSISLSVFWFVKNVNGLILSKIYDKKAAMKYASKIESRVKGPFYVGQREIIARKLPVSSVERLISAVTKLTREQEVDLLMINLTKTKGENQSLEDMFAAIEEIKDGFIVDTMYGK